MNVAQQVRSALRDRGAASIGFVFGSAVPIVPTTKTILDEAHGGTGMDRGDAEGRF